MAMGGPGDFNEGKFFSVALYTKRSTHTVNYYVNDHIGCHELSEIKGVSN